MTEAQVILKFEAKDRDEIYAIIGDIRRMMNARGKKIDEIYAKYQESLV